MDFVRVPLQPQALKERLARFTLSTWRLRREYLCLARSSIQFLEILPLPFAIEASADACGGSECPLFGPVQLNAGLMASSFGTVHWQRSNESEGCVSTR